VAFDFSAVNGLKIRALVANLLIDERRGELL
jgi:hypothetical protein